LKVTVPGLGDVKPWAPLDPTLYGLYVDESKVVKSRSGRQMLQLNMHVTEGPTQMNGSEPEGRRIVDFIMLDMAGSKPESVEFLQRKVDRALESFGVEKDGNDFEPDDFVGKTASATIKTTLDQDGEQRDTVNKYRPEE